MAPDNRKHRKPAIILSRDDHARLTRLADSVNALNPELADDLFSELERARLVANIERHPDVVRMGSTLRFSTDSGEERRVTLVFPAEADIAGLMLKGVPLGDIARLRRTSEVTIRQQAQSVYRKSGLSGRAELAAFFLESLFEDAGGADGERALPSQG